MLILRDATRADANLLLGWANDPTVRSRAIRTSPIGLEEHVAWLVGVLDDPRRFLFVAELDGAPVGQIRFDPIADDVFEIGISVASERRGSGLGRELIAIGLARMRDRPLGLAATVARVREDNAASLRAFASNGFATVGHECVDGIALVRLERRYPATGDH